MAEKDGVPPGRGIALDQFTVACYEAALRLGQFTDHGVAGELNADREFVRRAREILSGMRLLTPAPSGDGLVPVDPDTAELSLTTPLERHIADRREMLAHLRRELRVLGPIYAQRARPATADQSVQVIDDPVEVRRWLERSSLDCRDEVMSMRPGAGRDADAPQAVLPHDLAMLQRGVSMKILYQHTARASQATCQYVRSVSEAGAQVRTIADLGERLVIFDRRLAFVPQARAEGDWLGAVIVTEPGIVDFLYRVYDNTWLAADRFDADSVQYERTASAIESSILQLMSQGLKDDVIARRVGLATRTCRRYITSILEQLGATSRFQAGVRAAELGLVGPYTAAADPTPGASPAGS